jgi:hypothetical protein
LLPCTRPFIKEEIYNTFIKNRSLSNNNRTLVAYDFESWALRNKTEELY